MSFCFLFFSLLFLFIFLSKKPQNDKNSKFWRR